MSLVRLVQDRTRQALRTGGLVGLTGTMIPILMADLERTPTAEKDVVRDRWVRRWARALLGLFSVTLVVEGDVPAPTRPGGRGRLIVVNHRSVIDIGVMLATFGGTMVSRADVATWPILGAAARAVGTVFVDRASRKSGAATLRAIQRRLEEGETIVLFPEGTTFAGDEVHPFHPGSFVAAARAGAEIVAVGLAYPAASGAAYIDESFMTHLGRLARSTSTRAAVVVGAPISAQPKMKIDPLVEEVKTEVARLVVRAREVCGP